MTINISMLLRKWDFDLETETLGRVRCAHLDVTRKLAEVEAAVLSKPLDGIEISRDVFQSIAHRLTGDDKVDAECGGDLFSEAEVRSLTRLELDGFCEKLINGRLRLAEARRADGQPVGDPISGCDRILGAMRAFVDAERSEFRRLADEFQKSASFTATLTSTSTGGIAAAMAGLVPTNLQTEMEKFDRQVNVAMGIGPQSHTATDIVASMARDDEALRAKIGGIVQESERIRADIEAARGYPSSSNSSNVAHLQSYSTAMEEIQKYKDFEQATLNAMPKISDDGPYSPNILSVPHTLLPPVAPPNPVHKTNEKFDSLLEHQKKEAAKKDIDRDDGKKAGDESQKIAKRSLWIAALSLLAAVAIPTWQYYDGKAAAEQTSTEASKKGKEQETQAEQLRAEIRALSQAEQANRAAIEKLAQDKAEKPPATLAAPKPATANR